MTVIRYGRRRVDKMQSEVNDLRALPAVQVEVKPLRYITPDGETLDQMREHARQDPLAKQGDMKLVWVNEGDLYNHTMLSLIITAPDTAKVAALVEALRYMVNHAEWREQNDGVFWEATNIARAALAAWKEG